MTSAKKSLPRLFYTPREVRELLRCGFSVIYSKIADGTFRSTLDGSRRLIFAEDVDRYIARLMAEGRST